MCVSERVREQGTKRESHRKSHQCVRTEQRERASEITSERGRYVCVSEMSRERCTRGERTRKRERENERVLLV